MTVKHISAVTLAVSDMSRAVDFYKRIGLGISYGGADSSFTTFQAGEAFLNLILRPAPLKSWWGRIILRVEGVDAIYNCLKERGLEPEKPQGASWGERFFHIWDPDGHELSFAELLPINSEG